MDFFSSLLEVRTEAMNILLREVLLKAYRTLAPVRMRNALSMELVLEKDLFPSLVDRPPGGRILVLAPHMDDEILGCGGTLRKHVLAGDRVTIAYVTDGRKGNASLNQRELLPSEREELEEKVAELRREEACRATAVLGIKDLRFLNHRDQEVEASRSTCAQIAQLVEEIRPETVYLPFLIDRHRDHLKTNEIFLGALALLQGRHIPEHCCAYEVWTPLYPNCLVDVSEVIELKKRALAEFKSQMEAIDFSRSIVALHAYRSMTHLRGRGYAEAFYLTTPLAYQTLFRKVRF